MIDSVFTESGENFYSQVLLEECKYVVKKNDDWVYYWSLQICCNDSGKKNSDEKNSVEENSNKKSQV